MEKILVSACFLGELVRYNAKQKKLSHHCLSLWLAQGRLISICPEVIGGLSVPRAPAEINSNTKEVITANGDNVTAQFSLGAKKALELCKVHDIKYALLKESSPSCGSQFIYDGSFTNQKIVGQGITTQLLVKHGISVFSEETIESLVKILPN